MKVTYKEVGKLRTHVGRIKKMQSIIGGKEYKIVHEGNYSMAAVWAKDIFKGDALCTSLSKFFADHNEPSDAFTQYSVKVHGCMISFTISGYIAPEIVGESFLEMLNATSLYNQFLIASGDLEHVEISEDTTKISGEVHENSGCSIM